VNRQQTIEWERQWALPAALCAFGAAVLFVAGTYVAQSAPVAPSTNTELLREYYDNSGTLLVASVMNGISLFLFVPVVYYLFRAASARSPVVRRGLVGVVVIGPVFLGAAGIFRHVALSAAATDFATPGGGAGIPIGTYAESLLQDQTVYGVAQGLGLAGVLGFVFGLIYTGLWAMRTGLLTRFFGTFGMALGASLMLLAQAFSLLALMLWGIWLGLIFLAKVPGGRPPAWDAGEAIPWPKPGKAPAEPKDPDAIDAEAAELFAGDNGENPNAARRERAKKRKRKRRQ
jgi:hypothetical protein